MSTKDTESELWRTWNCPDRLKHTLAEIQQEINKRRKDYRQTWFAKFASVNFQYEGEKYELKPETFDITDDFLERMTDYVIEKLKEIGCTDATSFSMID